MKTTKWRILIADDHTVVRMGLSALLGCQGDIEVVGEATNGAEAVERTKLLKPDVVIMDLSMPILNGAAATRKIRESAPETRVLVLTSFGSSGELVTAVRNGATGVLMKDASNDELLSALRTVAAGGRVIPREVERALADDSGTTALTPRQLDVLRAASNGFSSEEIAKTFGITSDCVKKHFTVIFEKLGVANRTEAVALALRKGLA